MIWKYVTALAWGFLFYGVVMAIADGVIFMVNRDYFRVGPEVGDAEPGVVVDEDESIGESLTKRFWFAFFSAAWLVAYYCM